MDREDECLRLQLEDLKKQLGKKQKFEEAVFSLKSLLRDRYPSAAPSLRILFYSVICRVATILKTRYTAPGFWLAGFELFEQAEPLLFDASEKEHMKACILQAREHLHQVANPSEASESTGSTSNRGYLFEGHLTVDPEPPQPQWLVHSNLLTAAATLFAAESSQGLAENNNTTENPASLVQELMRQLDDVLPLIPENDAVPRTAPPASKEVVAKLPVVTLTEEILAKLGKDAECAICKENLVVSVRMQELPCKHTFHPPCLKPWLDEHNSCPICRHELQTDDHAYESRKEREKEAEEERRGAANAIRGGEYMYV